MTKYFQYSFCISWYGLFSFERVVIKDYLFGIIENLSESFIWRGSAKGSCEGVMWRGHVKGLWFIENLIESSLWIGCHKGLFVYDLLRTLWRGSSQGFIAGVHRRGSVQGFSEGFYRELYLIVLIISYDIYVLQEIVYNTYAEMSNIMWSE